MVASAVGSVSTTEWALKYDWWGESVSETPQLKPGLVYVGMGNYLIKFPNTVKNVYFRRGWNKFSEDIDDIVMDPLAVRTADGLSIDLELEFTYQLQPEKLYNLYMLTGEDYKTVLSYLSMGVIDNYATKFSATEFYQNRTLIQETFNTQLTKYLNDYLFMNLKTLQLQPATFPQAYTDSIKLTQYYNTDCEVAQQEQLTAMIQKSTQLMVSQTLATKVKIEAEAQASKTMLGNNATVKQYKYRQYREAEGYSKALDAFQGINEPGAVDANNRPASIGEFMTYLQVRALKAHDTSQTTVRLAAPR
jgi:hypothetical protein